MSKCYKNLRELQLKQKITMEEEMEREKKRERKRERERIIM